MNSTPHLKWVGVVALSFFMPFSFTAAQSCGDFIYTYVTMAMV